MVWVDYKKAYDIVAQLWIIECHRSMTVWITENLTGITQNSLKQ